MRGLLETGRQWGLAMAILIGLGGSVVAEQPKPVTVTEKESGNKVALAKGQELVVSLEIRTGTGYTWQVAGLDGKLLEQVGKPVLERTDNKPGAPARQVFRFKATAAGSGMLELNYLRPFEKDAKPAKQFKMSVAVKE